MSLRTKPHIRVSEHRVTLLDGQVCQVNPQVAGDPLMIHRRTANLICMPNFPSLVEEIHDHKPEVAPCAAGCSGLLCRVVFGSFTRRYMSEGNPPVSPRRGDDGTTTLLGA